MAFIVVPAPVTWNPFDVVARRLFFGRQFLDRLRRGLRHHFARLWIENNRLSVRFVNHAAGQFFGIAQPIDAAGRCLGGGRQWRLPGRRRRHEENAGEHSSAHPSKSVLP